jgi:hypothetical protein
MLGKSTRVRKVRVAVCIGLATASAGCATWRVADEGPQQVVSTQRPDEVRVTTTAGEQSVLRQPRILGSVLAGFDAECLARFGSDTDRCEETGIALFEIASLEVKERGWHTNVIIAVVGLGVVWLLVNR